MVGNLVKKATHSEAEIKTISEQLCERIDAELGNTSLNFFDNTVILIKASVSQLESSLELIANLEEVRIAKDTPYVIANSSLKDQANWAEDISNRLRIEPNSTTSVCIMDAGVNYNHPLLKDVAREEYSENWIADWPNYEEYDPLKPSDLYHGSLQAGLSTYGEMTQTALSKGEVHLTHNIESARILPSTKSNSQKLYGRITIDTALKHEIVRPEINRVYSLAVTAPPGKVGGQPSSWSAAVDEVAFGAHENNPRLFVISAGNNSRSDAALDNWGTVRIEKIENPAQAWNALTVGAFTELTTNDDPTLNGWSPYADSAVYPHIQRHRRCGNGRDKPPTSQTSLWKVAISFCHRIKTSPVMMIKFRY